MAKHKKIKLWLINQTEKTMKNQTKLTYICIASTSLLLSACNFNKSNNQTNVQQKQPVEQQPSQPQKPVKQPPVQPSQTVKQPTQQTAQQSQSIQQQQTAQQSVQQQQPVQQQPSQQPAQKKSEFWIFDGSTDAKEYHLWVTDGTADGTKELHPEYTMKSTPGKDWMIRYSDKLVFLARHEADHDDHEDHDHDEHDHEEHDDDHGKKEHKDEHKHEHDEEKSAEAPHLLISDGTRAGTKRLLGNSVNSFENVASPFFEINNKLYFLGFDKTDRYSIFETDGNSIVKASVNLGKQMGLSTTQDNLAIKKAGQNIYLFTKLPNNNAIYRFNPRLPINQQLKKIIDTGNEAVAHPIQLVEQNNMTYVMTKPMMGAQRKIYGINTVTDTAKLIDDGFLPLGIANCDTNKVCGLSFNNQRTLDIRIIQPDQSVVNKTMKRNGKGISSMDISSFHNIDNTWYILLKDSNMAPPPAMNTQAPKQMPSQGMPMPSNAKTLYSINAEGVLNPVEMPNDVAITSIAKRKKSLNLLQRHPVLNNHALLFIEATEKDKPNACYEPWVLNLQTQSLSLLKNINKTMSATATPTTPLGFGAPSCKNGSFTQETRPIQLNAKLLFIANDGKQENDHGNEWWSTDMTTAKTKLVKDIAIGKKDGVLIEKEHHHGQLP